MVKATDVSSGEIPKGKSKVGREKSGVIVDVPGDGLIVEHEPSETKSHELGSEVTGSPFTMVTVSVKICSCAFVEFLYSPYLSTIQSLGQGKVIRTRQDTGVTRGIMQTVSIRHFLSSSKVCGKASQAGETPFGAAICDPRLVSSGGGLLQVGAGRGMWHQASTAYALRIMNWRLSTLGLPPVHKDDVKNWEGYHLSLFLHLSPLILGYLVCNPKVLELWDTTEYYMWSLFKLKDISHAMVIEKIIKKSRRIFLELHQERYAMELEFGEEITPLIKSLMLHSFAAHLVDQFWLHGGLQLGGIQACSNPNIAKCQPSFGAHQAKGIQWNNTCSVPLSEMAHHTRVDSIYAQQRVGALMHYSQITVQDDSCGEDFLYIGGYLICVVADSPQRAKNGTATNIPRWISSISSLFSNREGSSVRNPRDQSRSQLKDDLIWDERLAFDSVFHQLILPRDKLVVLKGRCKEAKIEYPISGSSATRLKKFLVWFGEKETSLISKRRIQTLLSKAERSFRGKTQRDEEKLLIEESLSVMKIHMEVGVRKCFSLYAKYIGKLPYVSNVLAVDEILPLLTEHRKFFVPLWWMFREGESNVERNPITLSSSIHNSLALYCAELWISNTDTASFERANKRPKRVIGSVRTVSVDRGRCRYLKTSFCYWRSSSF
ncbi:hypothetical protein ADUPG1_008961 [Aduncisulcus paluster]|uniref:Uncharacterized protein n=1 Tax=Aduncisulcus paluster TaxID=2918883 RepID=A0ABQ5KV26_9EUKA|nr:hypothetical protein ADUPG1_008961 [Aduncisulcus paluster]